MHFFPSLLCVDAAAKRGPAALRPEPFLHRETNMDAEKKHGLTIYLGKFIALYNEQMTQDPSFAKRKETRGIKHTEK